MNIHRDRIMRIVAACLITGSIALAPRIMRAQEAQKEQRNVLELPEFVITGTGPAGIMAVRTQDPRTGWALDSASRALFHSGVVGRPIADEGDSIPATPAPPVFRGAGHVEYGIYRTPQGWLQYDAQIAPVDLVLRAEGFATEGSIDGATASGYRFSALGMYRVPDNVMTVMNARAFAGVGLGFKTYALYGSAQPATERRVTSTDLSLGMTQETGDVPFAFDVRIASRGAKDSMERIDKLFGLRGSVGYRTTHFLWDASADIRNATARISTRSFSELRAGAHALGAPFRYTIGGLITTAGNSMFGTTSQIAPYGGVEYDMAPMQFFATFDRRYRDRDIASLLDASPYVAGTALDSIRPSFDAVDLRAGVRIPSDRMVTLEASLEALRTDDDAVFTRDSTGTFAVQYRSTSTIRLAAEGRAAFAGGDVAFGRLVVQQVTADGSRVPYTPIATISAAYDRPIVARVRAGVRLDVDAGRVSDFAGTAMNTVALVGLDGSYAIDDRFTATLRLDNLLNQRYEVWTGYAATRIFAAIGLSGRF